MNQTNIQHIIQHGTKELKAIAQKVKANERISDEDALYLFKEVDVATCGALANYRREQKNGLNTYYNH